MPVFSAATLQAGGLDNLKAAKAAAEQGKTDEAVRLYSQALASSDLAAADRLDALKGRASEYTAKSLIADAFERLDQARQARVGAIADFTAALKLKTDDAALYVARAQTYALDRQNDAAIADFDAAIKLDKTPVTLVQRGSSLLAKGDYDRAIADYTAAIALPVKRQGWQGRRPRRLRSIQRTRQGALIAAHYPEAAADFDKAITLGAAGRNGDVLWLPYQAAWLHIARARAGQDDAEELKRNAGNINLKQWPGTLVAYFLGQAKVDELTPPSDPRLHGACQRCNLSFFAGEQALAKKDSAGAAQLFNGARAACNIHTVQYLATGVELKRLGK